MPACDVNLKSIFPSCEALNSVAGVRTFGFYCRRIDITNYARDTEGTITGVTIATGKLKKFETGKFQNSGAFALAASTIGKKRFTQTYINRVYYRSQADRNAMKALILAEDVVVFSPNNDNQIEIYGADLGLDVTTVAGGTGTKLDDDNTALLTLTGAESDLPVLFSTVVGTITATSTTATTASTSLGVVSATGIVAGQSITGTGIPANTTVVALTGTTLTLSAPATVGASAALTLVNSEEQVFQANVDYLDTQVGP